MSPGRCQQGDGRVRDVFAVSQVQPLQLGHVALQQPQSGLADVQTGQTQSHHVPQSTTRRLGTCGGTDADGHVGAQPTVQRTLDGH